MMYVRAVVLIGWSPIRSGGFLPREGKGRGADKRTLRRGGVTEEVFEEVLGEEEDEEVEEAERGEEADGGLGRLSLQGFVPGVRRLVLYAAAGHDYWRRGGRRHDQRAAGVLDVGPVRGQLRVRHVRLRDAPGVRAAVVVAAERVGGARPGRVLMRVREQRLLDDLVRGLGRTAVTAAAAAEQLLERHQQGQRERDLAD